LLERETLAAEQRLRLAWILFSLGLEELKNRKVMRRRWGGARITTVLVLLATAFSVIAAYAFAQFSPWPMVLMRRLNEDRSGVKINEALERFVPAGISAKRNLQYERADKDALLDVFYPSAVDGTNRVLPTVVWVHGGSWVTGSKDLIVNYLKILASKGFIAVGVDYGLAPANLYPTPVKQVNEALDFLQRNGEELHADSSRFFLAGDSAGAQIAAQLANVITSPSYASDVGITPSIQRSQLKGVVFHSGAYEAKLASYRRNGVLWAYFGTKDFATDPRLSQFSVARHVTPNFPPMFISAGNEDALAPQSYLFADNVANNGVYVDRLFFSQNYMPKVWHQFQFFLDTKAARIALERSVEFMNARLK
jgi:acetyl esterase